jgi:hypothetical protein
MTNVDFAQALREMADFYEQHPKMPRPEIADTYTVFSVNTKDEFTGAVRQMANGGKVEKSVGDTFYQAARTFGAGLVLRVVCYRDAICRKVTKLKVVKESVPVRYETRTEEVNVPVAFEEREVEKEVTEWECPESILEPEGVTA